MADTVSLFLDYLRQRECSVQTQQDYGLDLAAFSRFLAGKSLEKVTATDIRGFLAHRLTSVSPATAERQLMALRSFYGFLLDEELIAASPAHKVAHVKKQLPVVIAPTLEEIEKMLAAVPITGTAKQVARALRNRAIVLACYGSGLRVSEIISLAIRDIDFQRSIITVRCGKGRKDRLTPMNPREAAALADWLKHGRPIIASGHKHCGDLVFIARRKTLETQFTRQSVSALLAVLSRKALGRVVSPHKLRHTFCTDMVNRGGNIRVVQAMLGHVSLNTTQRYLHCNIETLQAQYLKFHPRGEGTEREVEVCKTQSNDFLPL